MKTQLMLEKDSAMAMKQKYTILANELTRRLYNIDDEEEENAEEVEKTIEQMTRQLKNSGWNRKETREIITSGFKGWKRRMERRMEETGEKYRSAAGSLSTRSRKKLTGKEDWFKGGGNKRKREDHDEEPRTWKKTRTNAGEEKRMNIKNISVMFIPYTVGGELAKQLRQAEEELGRRTGYKIKIVERTGTKLEDMLHKSNPWQGQDCERPGCLICLTKTKTMKKLDQDCTKRNITYETWCRSCERKEIKNIEESTEDEEERKVKIRRIKLYKYIGESSRSGYERGLEHQKDLKDLKMDSHMLKHYFSSHENEELREMEFGMRLVKSHRTAFNRQISESVEIQNQKRDHYILNSKSEYNRCALPRLTAKIGEESYSKMEKQKKAEKEEERLLERRIRELKVKQNLEKKKDSFERRQDFLQTEQPAGKKRKLNKYEYKRVLEQKKEAKKRERMEKAEEKETGTYEIFELSRRKKHKTENRDKEVEAVEVEETETRWEKAWTQEEWNKRIKEQQDQLDKEEEERNKRITLSKRLQQGWELLRVCKEIMETEGYKWKISKERQEMERNRREEKEERLRRAQGLNQKAIETENMKQIQKKITESLRELPGNRRILLERELEKERRLLIKEQKRKYGKNGDRRREGMEQTRN